MGGKSIGGGMMGCVWIHYCARAGRMLGFGDFYGGKFSVLWLNINQNARVELAEGPFLVGKISSGGMLGFKHF